MTAEAWKREAAHRAIAFIEDGMVIGLGHGSTAAFAVERIAALRRLGKLQRIVCIPCSKEVEAHAERLGLPLTSLHAHPAVDVTIDGADEVDAHLHAIKGGGGALLREKIVASASAREVIVVDGSKLSPRLGTHFAVPVEVIPFASTVERLALERLGAHVLRRGGDDPFVTDEGNHILDCDFGPIDRPGELAARLDRRPGVVAHGLFLEEVTDLVTADERGVRHLPKNRGSIRP